MLQLYFQLVVITAVLAVNIDPNEVSEDDSDDECELNTCDSQGMLIHSHVLL
jgi:hypothetical protein